MSTFTASTTAPQGLTKTFECISGSTPSDALRNLFYRAVETDGILDPREAIALSKVITDNPSLTGTSAAVNDAANVTSPPWTGFPLNEVVYFNVQQVNTGHWNIALTHITGTIA